MLRTTSSTLLAITTSVGVAGTAAAATPTYYDNLADFEADVIDTVTDDYSDPGYVLLQNNVDMSNVLGETDYVSTGVDNWNVVSGENYCAGCNGSFELSFLTTSVAYPTGVNGVGLNITAHDLDAPYVAFITFADGEEIDVVMGAPQTFWGVSAPERIERIHFGLEGGGAIHGGYFEIDNLVIGDLFDPTPCGDGFQTADEACDTAGESATCDTDCTLPECGDDIPNEAAGEACDDGGATPTCNTNCTVTTCGDGVVHPNLDEACDTAGESATCNANCTLPQCGDMIANEAAGEACDDGGESATCNADCTALACGDGLVNQSGGEDCDHFGESATCDIDCTIPMCGDGVDNVTAGEECDDSAESPACDPDCTFTECGDGYENNTAGEYCDDGNLDDGDGCSATCTNEEIETSEGGESSSEGGESTDSSTTDASTTDAESSGGPSDTGESTDTPADTTGGSGDSAPATETTAPAESSSTDAADTSGGASGTADDSASGCGCAADPIDGDAIAWSGLVFAGAFATRRRRR